MTTLVMIVLPVDMVSTRHLQGTLLGVCFQIEFVDSTDLISCMTYCFCSWAGELVSRRSLSANTASYSVLQMNQLEVFSAWYCRGTYVVIL